MGTSIDNGSTDARDLALAEARRLVRGTSSAPADPDRDLVVHDPASGEPIVALSGASPAAVAFAVTRCREAFDRGEWSRLAPIGRARVLWRVADLIEEHAAELARLETLDNGKPIRDATLIDIPQSAAHFRFQAAAAARLEGSVPATANFDGLTVVAHEPVGVVAAITPWNFPLLMASRALAPILAAGNCAVLKPAEETPLSALRLAELLAEAGLPESTLEVVIGRGETTGHALVSHPDVDQIAFTGGRQAARQIVAASTERFARLSLELGGKSPALVLPDADLATVVAGIAHGAFSNQGQNCCAATRVLVAAEAADALAERLAEAADRLRVRSGFDADVDLGPLVSAAHRDRVEGLLDVALEEGASVVGGGGRPEDLPGSGYWMRPTVLDDVAPGARITREEVFGPVVFIQRYDDLDEAVRIANDTEYGLAAGIFTGDLDLARRIGRRLDAGTIWVNAYERFDAAVPFGGRKQSGYGQSVGGRAALEEFCATKSYWFAGLPDLAEAS